MYQLPSSTNKTVQEQSMRTSISFFLSRLSFIKLPVYSNRSVPNSIENSSLPKYNFSNTWIANDFTVFLRNFYGSFSNFNNTVYLGQALLFWGAVAALLFLFPLLSQFVGLWFSILSLAITLNLTLLFSSYSILLSCALAIVGLGLIGYGSFQKAKYYLELIKKDQESFNENQHVPTIQSYINRINQLTSLGFCFNLLKFLKYSEDSDKLNLCQPLGKNWLTIGQVSGLIDLGCFITLDILLKFFLKLFKLDNKQANDNSTVLLDLHNKLQTNYPAFQDRITTSIRPVLEIVANFVINKLAIPLAQVAGNNGVEGVSLIKWLDEPSNENIQKANMVPAILYAVKGNYKESPKNTADNNDNISDSTDWSLTGTRPVLQSTNSQSCLI